MTLSFDRCLQMPGECAVFWAGWGTIATAGVGFLTLLVAFLAWRTSRQAARIATNQHQDSVALREAQARIVGRLLLHEVLGLPAKLRYHTAELDSLDTLDPEAITDWASVQKAVSGLKEPLLVNAEISAEQIHYLPDSLGADLATMISHSRDINAAARHIDEHIHRHVPQSGTYAFRPVYRYTGRPKAIAALRGQLDFVASIAPDFLKAFSNEVLGDGESSERNK